MSTLIIRHLGLQPYQPVWKAMQAFTQARQDADDDELWLLEHPPVFTQGLAGKAEHILNPHDIPIIQTDRGGQVTYHGPGQLVAYPLIQLKQHQLTIRSLVCNLEKCIINLLSQVSMTATGRPDAPGVYVNGNKICSIGLRVRRGYTFHGIALNVAMDLTPFSYINPCGFETLTMTQINEYVPNLSMAAINTLFIDAFLRYFKYTAVQELTHESIKTL